MSADEHAVHVEIRHRGRRYGAAALPNGRTEITRDGVWLANADWNGRVLFTGDHELHPDLDASNEILDALADALRAARADVHTRPGRDAYPRGRTD